MSEAKKKKKKIESKKKNASVIDTESKHLVSLGLIDIRVIY